MIIRKLHIEGFGIFKDHTVKGFRPGINVLYGRNESGKSTLLDFIRFTLFGYPRLTDERRPPLQGGNHGGKIDFVLKGEAEMSSLYRSGKNDIVFQHNNQEYTVEKDWRRFVDHAESDLYNNIYGITLDELTEEDKLTDSQMKDKIFSMGLGLADVKLGEVQSALRKNAEEIYLPRGRTQKLNQLSDEIDELQNEVRILKGTIDQFDKVNKELDLISKEREQLTLKIDQSKKQLQKAELFVTVFDRYVEWRNAEEQLEKLPTLTRIPSQVMEEYGEARKMRKQISVDIQDHQLKLGKSKREIDALEWDQVFEKHLSSERVIQENIRLAESSQEDLKRSQQQIKAYRNRQDEILTAWGDTLDRESILQITSLKLLTSQAQEIQEQLQDLEDTEKRLHDRKTDLAPRLSELKEQESQLNRSMNELNISSAEDKEAAADEIRSLQAQRGRMGVKTEEASTGSGIWILILIMGLLVAGAGFFIGSWDLLSMVLIVVGLGLLGISFWRLLASNRPNQSIEEWEELHKKEQILADQITAFDDLQDRRQQWEIQNASLSQQMQDVEEKLKATGQSKEQWLNQWKEHLSTTPIPDDWRPSRFLSAERDINEYLEKEEQISREGLKAERAKTHIDKLQALLEPFSMDDQTDLIGRAQQVLDQFERTREILQRKSQLVQQMQDVEASLQAKTVEESRLNEQIQGWEESYLDGEESWADHFEAQQLRDEWEAKRDEARKAMQHVTGPDELQPTLQALSKVTKVELEGRKQDLSRELEELETELNEFVETSGRLQQQIDELSKPDDLQKKLSQLESLETRMREAQLDWLSYRMAEEVLVQAQQQFEKEKQPRVIQNSEQYFQEITNGRYKRIELSIMDSDIRLETRTGQKKKVEELSRGTREQLLLALRLGLIEEYEEQAEDLPVALDDVFVNFDAQRAEQTARVLASFAKNRQIIIFTCHSSTRDLFSSFQANILDWTPDDAQPDLPQHLTSPAG